MNTSSREKQACTATSRVAVPGVVTTFSFSSPAPCCLHWTPKLPVSQEKPCLTPALLGQPVPGASLRKEQWIAKTKVTWSKRRPARGPASHLAQTLGTSFPVPPHLAAKASPNPCPRPWRGATAPRREPVAGGSRRGHSPAENWPWADPRRGQGERSKSATKAGSAAAAVSMSTLGEVSSSFAKSCRGDRSEIHD